MGQGYETINFEGHKVKTQCYTRPVMLTRPTVSRPRSGNTRPRPEVFKAKASQYKAKARGLQGQGLTLQRIKLRS